MYSNKHTLFYYTSQNNFKIYDLKKLYLISLETETNYSNSF